MSQNQIPIFDSLTHPSLDGFWFTSRHNGHNGFAENLAAMKLAGIRWAWAVSMTESASYDPDRYAEICAQADVTLLPAAFMKPPEFQGEAQIEDWLFKRKQQGFKGIKLHPRLGGFDFGHPQLAPIIKAANSLQMIPFLCTYLYAAQCGPFPASQQGVLTVEGLRSLLLLVPDEKLVILHGGGVRLLEVAEITRHFKKAMLDVSWTLCEYAGSSIDLDLRYVFDRCGHRVCIGSDAPEYTSFQMRRRFDELTAHLAPEHRERIAYRNLLEYSGL